MKIRLPTCNTRILFFVLINSIILFKRSGCHLNFAVTTAVGITGGMKVVMIPLYLLAQLLGSLSGAGIALVIININCYNQTMN